MKEMIFRDNMRLTIVACLCLLSSCDFLRIVTAKDHEPEVQSAATINAFFKKHDIEGCQVVAVHPDGYSWGFLSPEYPIFNKAGDFLQITDQNVLGCRDEDYFRLSMEYMLTHDQNDYIRDSIVVTSYISEPPHDNRVRHSDTIPIHLSLFSPYFVSLDGQHIAIDTLYQDLLLLYPFNLSGRSKLGAILLKETLEDVAYLEEKHQINISVVVVILDEFEWMSG